MKTRVALATIFATFLSLTAHAEQWKHDGADSRLEFIASYIGVDMPGEFARFDVELNFDPAAPGEGSLVVRVDIASVDMEDADVTEAAVGDVWLDAAGFSTAHFESENIRADGPDRFLADGTLELKGIAAPVAVPFTWRSDGARATMRGELVLQRLDFGVGAGTWSATDEVAGEVVVRFDVAFDRD